MNMKKINKKLVVLMTMITIGVSVPSHVNAIKSEVAESDVSKIGTDLVDPEDVTIENVLEKGTASMSVKLDDYGRPIESHYIGSDFNKEGKRIGQPAEPANIGPKNWKQFKTKDDQWFWDRGHLIGNQFGGRTSNDSKNIVGQTSYTNQVLIQYFEGGKKSDNANALSNWMYLHPNFNIDYYVFAHYNSKDDQYPVGITLKYRGISNDKQEPLEIKLPELEKPGAGKQKVDAEFYTSVDIQNIMPKYQINYKNGNADYISETFIDHPYEPKNGNSYTEVITEKESSKLIEDIEKKQNKFSEDIDKTVKDAQKEIETTSQKASGFLDKLMGIFTDAFNFIFN